MARPLRLEHSGAVWHVTSRGNARMPIFHDDRDRREFLVLLGKTIKRSGWRLHAFVLMGNHFHLLLETPEPTLSKGMHFLNGVYTQRFNRRHKRVGHVFQSRFKSILVEKERHLLELVRYVVLNPVRAGIVARAQEWRWSNFRATAGLAQPPTWLDMDWTLAQFGRRSEARRRYREFVSAGKTSESPWLHLRAQVYLGGDQFQRRIQERIDVAPRSSEVPEPQRRPWKPKLAEIVAATTRHFGVGRADLQRPRHSRARLALTYLARNEVGLRLGAFAEILGVKRWATSRLAARAKELVVSDESFRSDLDRIRRRLRELTRLKT